MQRTYLQQSFLPPPSHNPPGAGQVQQQPAPATAMYGLAAQHAGTPPDYYQIPQEDVDLNPAQYIPLSSFQMPSVVVAQPQNISPPPDFIILAVVATIVCAILNVLSLAFGVPAVIFSAMSASSKHHKDYPRAKDYGKYSLLLTTLNITFTLCVTIVIIGLVSAFYRSSYYYYRPYY